MKEKPVIIDIRTHVAVTSARFLPGGHAVCAYGTIFVFEASGFVGNRYYWLISDAKTLLHMVKGMIGDGGITQPYPHLLSEEELGEFARDLEHALKGML